IMAAPLGRDTLPDHWSYGVCRDGRVFFINDKTRSTTWLHPRTGEPVNSGHMIRSDLPRGWEEGFTEEGASYFINHNLRSTSFRHPVTGQISPENIEYTLQDRIESRMSKLTANQRSPSMVAESSRAVTPAATSRGSGKVHSFGKRDHAIKRNLNIPVVVRGWLYKQTSFSLKTLFEQCSIFMCVSVFVTDSREETVLGSIPLPSYVIAPVEPEDHINRKYAFKATHTGMRSYIYNKNSVIGSQAEHCGMRTYFFSADTQEDMNGWIRAMNQAALMQQTFVNLSHVFHRELEKSGQQAVPQTNHVHNTQISSKSDGTNRTDRGEAQDNGIRLAHGDEGRYGLEIQGKPSHAGPQERIERLSPDSVSGPPHKNGQQTVIQVTLPTEQNGSVVFQRGFVSRTDSGKHVQRKNTLAQVEQWVKVHKSDPTKRSVGSDSLEYISFKEHECDNATYQSLPKSPRLLSGSSSPPTTCNLPSDYKYAHDRLSHFRMSTDERMATKEGMVWQLYEWQQRQQFRHGSPTAPIYTGPNFTDSSSFRVTVEMPRSISVPPSPCEVPPSVPSTFKPLSPRRPHTPSDRRTVRPLDELGLEDSTRSSSPGNICAHLSQVLKRRSVPAMGYITHTVSAPSLHGKTVGSFASVAYCNLFIFFCYCYWHTVLCKSIWLFIPFRLCEQDKILQELEARIRSLKEDKDKLESVLDVSHHQMEEYRDQPAHAEKIAYQQKLLQEDVVHIRAEISQVSTEMENAWNEYTRLEKDVDWLKSALQGQMNRHDLSQEKVQLRKELWRIEDVIAGLSTNKANYKVTIASVTNPERKFVPSVPVSSVPSVSGSQTAVEMRLSQQQPQQSPHLSHDPTLTSSFSQQPLQHSTTIFSEDVPPRPPLPQLYSPEEHPPAVPPLPRETTVIRHTSVRGLKRQSDERKRDREIGQYTNGDSKVELRPFLSDPELIGAGDGSSVYIYIFLLSAASFILLFNFISSYSSQEKPKSALERLYSGDKVQHQQRGKMSADEQLERMKRHQKALVRQRKRTLSHGDRHASPTSRGSSSSRPLSADFGSWKREQEFDLQLLERAVQGEEAQAVRSVDLEPLEYDLDLNKELCKPQKVLIPERYVDSEPEDPLSPQEVEERHRKVERIKSILAKSRYPSCFLKPEVGQVALDSALQEQERIITMSYALASEASLKSKLVAGWSLV
uniref:Pleckstrin homology domain containing, family A member 7b n=1 Tax=Xiphophorus couchianus TaxID=32473 RepID=A0A3B5LZG6_9TELE